MTWSAEDIPDTSEGLVFETTKMLVGFMLALNLTEEQKIHIITGMVVDGADEDRQWKNIQKLREQLAGREKPTSEWAYLEAQKVIRAAGFVEEVNITQSYLETLNEEYFRIIDLLCQGMQWAKDVTDEELAGAKKLRQRFRYTIETGEEWFENIEWADETDEFQ